MPNPFDQFDAQPQAGGGNPFDAFDAAPAPAAPAPGFFDGLSGKSLLAGSASMADTVMHVLGHPIAKAMDWLATSGQRARGETVTPGAWQDSLDQGIHDYIEPAQQHWQADRNSMGAGARFADTAQNVAGRIPQMVGMLPAFLLDAGFQRGKQAIDEGQDVSTARKLGAANLVLNALGTRVPGTAAPVLERLGLPVASEAGQLTARVAAGAATNPAIGAGGAQVDKQILDANGYHDDAAKIHPLDPEQLISQALLGAGFGLHDHVNAPTERAPESAPLAPPVVPRQDTAAPAAGPADPITAIVQALHTAEPARGEDVLPPPDRTAPLTMPAPPRPTTPVEIPADRAPPPDRLQAAPESNVAVAERAPFAHPDEHARTEFTARAAEHGVDAETAAKLAPQAPVDRTTGFIDGRQGALDQTLERAQQHVASTGEPAVWVGGDIANLGGLNKHFGSKQADADVHYRAMAEILRDELQATGGDVVPMRTGGDEIGALVVNIGRAEADTAVDRARSRIQAYAREHGLDTIPHKEAGRAPGVSMHFGTADVVPGVRVKDILDEADNGIDISRAGGEHVAAGTPEAPRNGAPGGQPASDRVGSAAPVAGVPPEGRGGAAAAPAVERAPDPLEEVSRLQRDVADARAAGDHARVADLNPQLQAAQERASAPREARQPEVNSDTLEGVRAIADRADDKLESADYRAANAVTGFVGHGPRARDGGGHFGLMNARDLESAMAEGGDIANTIERTFAPVREELRGKLGGTVRLYRRQNPVETRDNVIYASRGEDGKRRVLSWTLDPKVAREFAGVRALPPHFSESEIAAMERDFEQKGEVKVGKSGYTLRRDTIHTANGPVDAVMIWRRGEEITDTDSVRKFVEQLNDDHRAEAADNNKRSQRIVSADIPLDDVVWVTDRAGQMEFIVKNAPGLAGHIDETGRHNPAPTAGDKPAAAEAATQPTSEGLPPTGTKHAVTDAERQAEGRPAREPSEPRTNEAALEAARADLEANPHRGDEVVEKLRSGGVEGISAHDEAVLMAHKVAVRAKRDAAAKRATDPSLSAEERAVARREYDDANAQVIAIDDAAANSGREWGRFGQLRQRLLRDDFTFEAMERKARVARDRPLTPEEQAAVRAQADKIAALQKRLGEAEARATFAEQQHAIVREGRKAAAGKQRTRSDRMQRMEQRAAEARARLRAKLGVTHSGVDPGMFADAATVGAYHLMRGVTAAAEWARAMRADLGDKLFRRLEPRLDELRKAAETLVAKERTSIDDILQKIDPDNITSRDIGQLVRAHILGGLDSYEAVMDAVHDDLKSVAPAITLDQVREAYVEPPAPKSPPPGSPEAATVKRIAQAKDKLETADFERTPRAERAKSKVQEKLEYELAHAKAEFARAQFEAQMARRPAWKKVLGGARETMNLSRAIITSFDLSGLLRQGGFISFGHPVRAAKAVPDMLRAFASAEAEHRINTEIAQRPNAPLYKRYGLELTDAHHHSLTKMEEAFMSRWVDKVPRALGGGIIRGSDRAYTTLLNRLRADTFDSLAATLASDKVLTPEEGKAIAKFVNIATGRGDIGKDNRAAVGLNTVFFAPRLVASRFYLLAGTPLYGGTARTRTLIASEYARYLTGMAVVYGLATLANDGDSPIVSLDPRSSDFLKLKFGEHTYLDPMAGLSQVTTFLTRELTGEKKSAKGEITPLRTGYRLGDYLPELSQQYPKSTFGRDDGADIAARFLRTKLAPVPGAVVNLATGKDVVGNPVGPGDVAVSMVEPMSMQDVGDIMQDNGVPRGTAIEMLNLLGMGVQYRKPRDKSKGN